jgi:hypothetical protein
MERKQLPGEALLKVMAKVQMGSELHKVISRPCLHHTCLSPKTGHMTKPQPLSKQINLHGCGEERISLYDNNLIYHLLSVHMEQTEQSTGCYCFFNLTKDKEVKYHAFYLLL